MAGAGTTQDQGSFWQYALWTVPLILGLGLASGWLSDSGHGNPWFDQLAKPSIIQPGWTFGAVWTTLYILLGESLALVLETRNTGTQRTALIQFGT